MMLRKGRPGVKRCQRLSGSRSYSSKVRVFPFVVPKEQAVQGMSEMVSLSTGYKMVGTFLRRWFPSMNVDALRPARIQPVYLPTWLVDARVQATLWLRKNREQSEFTKDDAEVQFAHSCMPGFVHRPLSEHCFATTDLLGTSSVEWSEDMRRHNGDDVLCLPFTLSPFKLIDSARKLPMADANVSSIIRFEPSSLQELMMAAYPVLVPIWLAQFVVQTWVNRRREEISITAFVEAGRREPRLYLETPPAGETLFRLLGVRNGPSVLIRGTPVNYPPRFTHVCSILGSHATLSHRAHIERWIDFAFTKGDPLVKYQEQHFAGGNGVVNWEDIRIRPFSLEERTNNLQWLGSAEDLFVLEKMLEVYGQKNDKTGLAPSDPGNNVEVSEDQIQSIRDKIDALKKDREKKKPEWLAQYEIQQRLLAEATSTQT